MSYKVAIVEDEFLVAEDLKGVLKKHGMDPVGIADNYKDGLILVVEESPDLVLIDINLGSDKGGIELAEILAKKHGIPFIFITSFSDKETVDKAKNLHPIGYIVKPFNEKNVITAIEIGMANWKPSVELNEDINQDFFFLKDRRMMKKVNFADIQFLQADDNYSYIFTGDTRYTVYLSLKELLKKLPGHFLRVHKSYIANIQYVSGLKSNELYLSNELKVPIGRSYRQELIDRLNFISSDS